MNLIEQLGGYECAKAEYNDPMYEDDELYTIKATGTRFFKQNLADELLEYRRQHNIFEVGDKVVLISMSDNEVFEYTEYSKGLDLHFFESEHNYGHAKLSDIRHATDAEIAAGKRLEVKSEN